MHTRSAVNSARRCRGAAISLGLIAAGLAVTGGGVAGAAPRPTVAQAQHRLHQLSTQADQLGAQFDQVKQELAAANQRLRLMGTEEARYQARFVSLRAQAARIAVTAYEEGGVSSTVTLLGSGNPQQILDRSSILLELSAARKAQMNQLTSAARGLTGAQQAARRVQTGVLALDGKLARQKKSLDKVIAQQQALIAQLTPAQQASATPGAGGATPGAGGSTAGSYTGPTSTQAGKAVAFAYAQLGKPYVWGATGPGAYDCSGLMLSAWAAAGVSIPRVSYDQISQLPAVPRSALQPGDLLGFDGNSHVAIYVGGGYVIDAPHSGAVVEKVSLSGWYSQGLDAIVRP